MTTSAAMIQLHHSFITPNMHKLQSCQNVEMFGHLADSVPEQVAQMHVKVKKKRNQTNVSFLRQACGRAASNGVKFLKD